MELAKLGYDRIYKWLAAIVEEVPINSWGALIRVYIVEGAF